jgi:acyl CoA:acetate/3-ketoacid CoA transferase beta subunit
MEEKPIHEVIAFLEHCRAHAKASGVLTEGNVPMNLADLDNAIIAAHKVLEGAKKQSETVPHAAERLTPEELVERTSDPVSKKKRF